MIFPGESLPGESFKEGAIRYHLNNVYQDHAFDLEVIQSHDSLLMKKPTELILGGILMANTRPDIPIDITLVGSRIGTNDTSTITVRNERYTISADGIVDADYPNRQLTEGNLDKVLFWLTPGAVQWTRTDTLRLAEKWQKLQDKLSGR